MGLHQQKLLLIEDIIAIEKIKLGLKTCKIVTFNDQNLLLQLTNMCTNIKHAYDIILFKHKLVDLSYFVLLKELKSIKPLSESNLSIQQINILKLKNNLLNKLPYLHLTEFEITYLKNILNT